MNLHQDFKMVKQELIVQRWMFNKIQNQGKKNKYKERSYNRSIIQPAFFFEKLSRDGHRNWYLNKWDY